MERSENNKAAVDSIQLLLVDDEKDYVNVLKNRLGKRGMSVAKAYSGEQAIFAVRNRDFDVAVVDLKMEDMDGLEVLKILKKMDPRLSILMLTGHGSQEAAQTGIELGAFDYLTKPCMLDELVEKIQQAYQAKKDAAGPE